MPKSGGQVVTLSKTQCFWLAMDDQFLFYSNYSNGAQNLLRIPKTPCAGSPCNERVIARPSPPGISDIQVDGDYVYFAVFDPKGGKVYRVTKNGDQELVLTSQVLAPYFLAIDSTSVYVTATDDQRSIVKIPK
jgi:hypothetical protein